MVRFLPIILASLVILAPPLAAAQEADSFLDCRQVTDDAERLACYDRLADTLSDVPEETRRTEADKAAREAELARLSEEERLAARVAEEKQNFGGERIKNKESEELVDSLTQPVTSFSVTRSGELRFTLANGQVWEQLGGDNTRFINPQAEDFQTATIKRGFLGSYRLTVEPSGKSIKARRIE